ncbi:hypothetical protein PGT21_000079, partial [Puccinia graminis f. sp. tritici]
PLCHQELNTSPTTPSPRVPDQPYFKVRGLAVPQKCRAQQRGLVPQGLHVYFDQQAAFSSKPHPETTPPFTHLGQAKSGHQRPVSNVQGSGISDRHELCQLIIRISYLNAWDLGEFED